MERSPECLHAGKGRIGPRGRLHTHPFDEYLLITSGEGEVTIAAQVHKVIAGDMLYYPIDTVHQERSDALVPTEYIFFTAKGPRPGTIGPLTHDTDGRVRVLSRWLLEEMLSLQQDRKRSLDALMNAILVELARLTALKPVGPVDAIRRYLRDNLGQRHEVEGLAQRAGMSRYHFIRTYRKSMGYTPMEDLRRMRVEAACDLLLTTTLPLKQISQRVGFYDEFHFSRVFRRYHHVSPGSFRRKT